MAYQQNWKMPAQVIRVVNGDTIDLACDLGFRTSIVIRARLYGIDASERRGEDHEEGVTATMALVEIIDFHRINIKDPEIDLPWLIIETHKNRKDGFAPEASVPSFGIWIVRLIGHSGTRVLLSKKPDFDINRELVRGGYAVPADYGVDKSSYWNDVPK